MNLKGLAIRVLTVAVFALLVSSFGIVRDAYAEQTWMNPLIYTTTDTSSDEMYRLADGMSAQTIALRNDNGNLEFVSGALVTEGAHASIARFGNFRYAIKAPTDSQYHEIIGVNSHTTNFVLVPGTDTVIASLRTESRFGLYLATSTNIWDVLEPYTDLNSLAGIKYELQVQKLKEWFIHSDDGTTKRMGI